VDGTITSVAAHCGTIFVGGSFHSIGASTGAAALVDRITGRRERFPRFSGAVNAVASDGRGGWFVGGSLEGVGGRPCHSLAHVRAGAVDWCAADLGSVARLAADGHRLYVATGPGGPFACCARLLAFDLDHPHAARWRLALPPRHLCRVSGNCGEVSRADALVARGSTVYAGGVFGSVGGKSGRDLVAVDGASGRALNWNAHVTNARELMPSETEVGALALAGKTLFVGGAFTSIGGAYRVGLAALGTSTARATTWHPRLHIGFGDVDNGVPWAFGIVASRRRVYVGGFFDAVDGKRTRGFAALDRATARPLRWRSSLRFGPSAVLPVASAGGLLYVAGQADVDGEPVFVTAVDASTGRAGRWRPRTNGDVYSVAADGDDVLLGGSFSSVNTVPRAGLAAIDGVRDRVLPWHPVLRAKADLAVVRSLLATDRTLYVGGAFFSIDGRKRRGLAAFDLPSLDLQEWHPRLDSDEWSHAKALALVGDTLYVAGQYTALNGDAREGFGAVSAKSARTVGQDSFSDAYSGFIVTLQTVGDAVYGGGYFTSLGPGLVAFDARTGALRQWRPDIGGRAAPIVEALAAGRGSLYVAGIDVAGSAPLARVDAADGHRLPFSVRIVGTYGPQVDALVITRAGLYIAGPFESVDGASRNGIALVDSETGHVKPWRLSSCAAVDRDLDYNPSRVLVVVKDRIVTNCRALGEGQRLVVVRAAPSTSD
jgi:hypothetical protein